MESRDTARGLPYVSGCPPEKFSVSVGFFYFFYALLNPNAPDFYRVQLVEKDAYFGSIF